MGRQGRAGIGAVHLDRGVAVGDADRAALAAGAGGQRAGVERQHAGHDLDARPRRGRNGCPGRRHRRPIRCGAGSDSSSCDGDAAGLDDAVHAGGDAGVGQRVAAIEFGADDLGDLEIGMDLVRACSPRLLRPSRPGRRARQRCSAAARHRRRPKAAAAAAGLRAAPAAAAKPQPQRQGERARAPARWRSQSPWPYPS